MFDGDTYAAYVMRAAVQQTQESLKRWSREQLRAAPVDVIADLLVPQVEILPLTYLEEDSGWEWKNPSVPTEGGRVRLRLGGAIGKNALAFFSMTPSNRAGQVGTPSYVPPDLVVVDGVSASNAVRALESLKANIDSLNRDLEREKGRLREHVINVVTARVREVDAEESAAAREIEALEQSGLRVLNPRSPAPSSSQPAEASLAVEEGASAVEAVNVSVEPLPAEISSWQQRDQDLLSGTSAAIARGTLRGLMPQVRDVRLRMEMLVDAGEPRELRVLAEIAAVALAAVEARLNQPEQGVPAAEHAFRIALVSQMEVGFEGATVVAGASGNPGAAGAFWAMGRMARFLRARWS